MTWQHSISQYSQIIKFTHCDWADSIHAAFSKLLSLTSKLKATCITGALYWCIHIRILSLSELREAFRYSMQIQCTCMCHNRLYWPSPIPPQWLQPPSGVREVGVRSLTTLYQTHKNLGGLHFSAWRLSRYKGLSDSFLLICGRMESLASWHPKTVRRRSAGSNKTGPN